MESGSTLECDGLPGCLQLDAFGTCPVEEEDVFQAKGVQGFCPKIPDHERGQQNVPIRSPLRIEGGG